MCAIVYCGHTWPLKIYAVWFVVINIILIEKYENEQKLTVERPANLYISHLRVNVYSKAFNVVVRLFCNYFQTQHKSNTVDHFSRIIDYSPLIKTMTLSLHARPKWIGYT